MSTVEDPIKPAKIEHLVDEEYGSNGELLFRYNYLRYEFEHPAGAIWARSYLAKAHSVAVYLPPGVAWDDQVVGNVIVFLRRRYAELTRLTNEGYEPV